VMFGVRGRAHSKGEARSSCAVANRSLAEAQRQWQTVRLEAARC